MAKKSHDDALGVAGAETLIGSGVVMKGNLKTEADITIDGQLSGHIQANGNVTVGVNAIINGNVAGHNVTVAGEVIGDISATGETTLVSTGNVHGNIHASTLAIASGAIFIGQSSLKRPERDTTEAPANLGS